MVEKISALLVGLAVLASVGFAGSATAKCAERVCGPVEDKVENDSPVWTCDGADEDDEDHGVSFGGDCRYDDEDPDCSGDEIYYPVVGCSSPPP